MAFAYYNRLSRRRQRTYRQSDAIQQVSMANAEVFFPLTDRLAMVLIAEDQKEISHVSSQLIADLCSHLKAPLVGVRVMARRPSDNWG